MGMVTVMSMMMASEKNAGESDVNIDDDIDSNHDGDGNGDGSECYDDDGLPVMWRQIVELKVVVMAVQ